MNQIVKITIAFALLGVCLAEPPRFRQGVRKFQRQQAEETTQPPQESESGGYQYQRPDKELELPTEVTDQPSNEYGPPSNEYGPPEATSTEQISIARYRVRQANSFQRQEAVPSETESSGYDYPRPDNALELPTEEVQPNQYRLPRAVSRSRKFGRFTFQRQEVETTAAPEEATTVPESSGYDYSRPSTPLELPTEQENQDAPAAPARLRQFARFTFQRQEAETTAAPEEATTVAESSGYDYTRPNTPLELPTEQETPEAPAAPARLRQFGRFTFQRQTDDAETTVAPESSGYSYQRPGKAFNLPDPRNTYGAPTNEYGAPDATTDAPSTETAEEATEGNELEAENVDVNNVEGGADQQSGRIAAGQNKAEQQQGSYVVLLPDGRLQRVLYMTSADPKKMIINSKLQFREIQPEPLVQIAYNPIVENPLAFASQYIQLVQ